ncbi:hypothetical protein ABGB12_11070 [Actinocorallia sp. B10E7]|uniref:hypothetical protein n=1 Tax=Actinocorallia sp. B10E7 TaxID=3153558 RepID=UPI00325F43D2
MRAGAATLVLGVVLMSTASTAQAAPVEPSSSGLVVHTTVTTGQPRRGVRVEAQTWVAATGTAAENATLSFSTEPRSGVRISAVCTLASQGHCKLGDVEAGGTTVPFTVEVPAGSTPLTLTIGAFARAGDTRSAEEYTKITFAPADRRTGSPSPPPSPTASPRPTRTTPSATAAPPPSAAAESPPEGSAPSTTASARTPAVADPSGALGLPSASPTDGSSPSGYPFTAQPASSPPGTGTTLVGEEVPPALALGQSIWLGVLLAACALAAALAFRRGARIRRRPEDPPSTGKHRPKGA